MSLHESTWDGAYLSPLSVCALPVLVAIVALRVLIREMPLRRQARHETLFDCVLFILTLSDIVWAATA